MKDFQLLFQVYHILLNKKKGKEMEGWKRDDMERAVLVFSLLSMESKGSSSKNTKEKEKMV